MELFKEGKAKFYADNLQTKKAEVFYNPKREFSRDINVLLISALKRKDLNGAELFSGSGVRGIRLCAETNAFSNFTFNDIKTADIIKKNIDKNKKVLKTKAIVTGSNAVDIKTERLYDYIDIDPFGSPVFYLDNAFSLIRKDGILAVSATDTAALLGSAQKACRSKYSSLSFKCSYSNEIGIRILIKRVNEIASKRGLSVKPLLFDFEGNFIRVYFKLTKLSKNNDVGKAYQCTNCPNRSIKKSVKCSFCGSKMFEIGPLWLKSIYDKDIVKNMLSYLNENKSLFSRSSQAKIRFYLERLLSELDVFSYYTTDEISSFFKKPEIKISRFENRTVLSSKGFRTTLPFNKFIN